MYPTKTGAANVKGLAVALFVFLAWVPGFTSQNQYCSITSQHTLCKFPGIGPRCKVPYETGIPTSDRNLIMSMHNSFRVQVATGNERKGRPGPQPSASNMRQMEWDEELAATAQRLADQCKYTHDCLDCRKVSRFYTGQNLYQFSENIVRNGADWDTAITAWYDEVGDWSPRHIDEFHFIKPLGHYTQMLWADTYKMGCGYSYFNDGKWNRKLYICNYGPAGNIITTPMYERGPPCSACPEGTRCSTQYNGLCTAGSSLNYAPKPQYVQQHTTPRPTFSSVVKYEPPTTRYTPPTTTTTRPTTTTTRRTTTTTTTTAPRVHYTPSTKAPFTYNEIDNNELSHNDLGFRRNNNYENSIYKFKPYPIATTSTTGSPHNSYNYYNYYDTKTTKAPIFSRFYFTNKPTTTTARTTTTTTSRPYQHYYYQQAQTTTTRRPISFSPRIYPKEENNNNGLTLFKISSNNNQDNIIRPTIYTPHSTIQSAEQFADAKVSRLSEPPVESVGDKNTILLFCDFDFAKCPIRFTGESWNYTKDDTPGYGRGFETIVPSHHVTNLYIRSMMQPQEDGNVCLHFRFINFRYGADGGNAKSTLSTVDHNGDPFSLRITAGTLRQKPKVVEITDLSRHSGDWLTARIQFRNLKSTFLLIFQIPTNFLQDNVYLAIDDILVTQGFCHT